MESLMPKQKRKSLKTKANITQSDSKITKNDNKKEYNKEGIKKPEVAQTVESFLNPDVIKSIASIPKDENVSAMQSPISALPQKLETKKVIEEIAEDIVDLIKWTNNIEKKQDMILEQLNNFNNVMLDNKRQFAIELNKIRVELLEDHKALVGRNAFDAIVPTLDSLNKMKNSLPQKHKQMHSQLEGIVGLLNNIIQSLGFTIFKVEEGILFDPAKMECLGCNNKGEPKTVVEVVRPGYKSGNMMIRPCGVIIVKKH